MSRLTHSSNEQDGLSPAPCSLRSPSPECLEVVLNGPVLCYEYMCSVIRRLGQDAATGVNRKVVLDFSAIKEIASPWTPVVATLIKWADSVPFQCVVQGLHGQAVRVFELLRNDRNVAALLRGKPFGHLPTGSTTDQPEDPLNKSQSDPSVRLNKTPGTPLCVTCSYNLTGLTSARCPECGWTIDWDRAIYDEDTHRVGSPVHGCTERHVSATVATVCMMVFSPLRFATRLRHDESLVPALVVALVSGVCTFLYETLIAAGGSRSFDWMVRYASTFGVFHLFAALVVLAIGGDKQRHKRERLFLTFSLYSTCFVALWSLVSRPLPNALFEYVCDVNSLGIRYYLSHSRPGLFQFISQMALLAWWGTIFAIFWLVRFPSQWRAVVYPAASVLGTIVAVAILGLALRCLL